MYIYTPYVYLIGWSKLDRYYIGSRYSKDCHPKDFWVCYFTSSNNVAAFREEHGTPDIIQIRKTFSAASEAVSYESTMLRRLNAAHDSRFLNQHNGDGKFYTEGPSTPKHRANISKAISGNNNPMRNPETALRVKNDVWTIDKRNVAAEKTKKDWETNPSRKDGAAERAKKLDPSAHAKNVIVCPVCGRVGRGNGMYMHIKSHC